MWPCACWARISLFCFRMEDYGQPVRALVQLCKCNRRRRKCILSWGRQELRTGKRSLRRLGLAGSSGAGASSVRCAGCPVLPLGTQSSNSEGSAKFYRTVYDIALLWCLSFKANSLDSIGVIVLSYCWLFWGLKQAHYMFFCNQMLLHVNTRAVHEHSKVQCL